MVAKSSKPAGDRPKPSDIMSTLDYYLVTKAPFQLPPNVREWIVKYGPWIDVVMLVLMAPAILLALGISAVALPFAAAAGPIWGLAVIAMVIQIGLLVLALPGLFARKKAGWNLVFYGVIIGLAYNLIHYNIIGGLVSALISCYVLFQIRSYYK